MQSTERHNSRSTGGRGNPQSVPRSARKTSVQAEPTTTTTNGDRHPPVSCTRRYTPPLQQYPCACKNRKRASSKSIVFETLEGPVPRQLHLQGRRGRRRARSTGRSGARPSPLTPTTNCDPTARSQRSNVHPLFLRTWGWVDRTLGGLTGFGMASSLCQTFSWLLLFAPFVGVLAYSCCVFFRIPLSV
ncbi:unnamed protein product [Ectocarpus sp. 12 AP-2014]